MALICYPIATGVRGRRFKCKNTVTGEEYLADPDFKFEGQTARDAYHETGKITLQEEGVILHGGWGGKKDPNFWQVVAMRQDPSKFKVVDQHGVNIATDFSNRLNAQKYIDFYRFVQKDTVLEPKPVPSPVTPAPAPSPAPVTPAPTPSADGPYPSIGKEMDSTTRGPTIRHYASDKDDDKTIEKNVKNIKFPAYQFLVDVKVTTIEHNDTVSLKYGGTHMDSGWFDNTIDFETGLVGLGTEEKHPSADLEIIKGDKIGSILNKKIRIAGVYFKKDNKCEMWTNLGNGWKKNAEGKNVGGFNPDSEINEAQLRIDGFEDVPEITRAVVQEIAVPNQ